MGHQEIPSEIGSDNKRGADAHLTSCVIGRRSQSASRFSGAPAREGGAAPCDDGRGASLTTQSFISAAAFQETTRVLTDRDPGGQGRSPGPQGEHHHRAPDPGGQRYLPLRRDRHPAAGGAHRRQRSSGTRSRFEVAVSPSTAEGAGARQGACPFACRAADYCAFVFLLSIIGIHFPSGPCISILKVYAVGESSLIVTRVLTFLPPIVPSSL
jgi:hypothetical protein